MADTLSEGQKLEKGGSLTSKNGAYTLTLQDDGNLVLAARGQAVWATGTNGQNAERLEVQTAGNCVLYTPDKPIWHTDTTEPPPPAPEAEAPEAAAPEVAPAAVEEVAPAPVAEPAPPPPPPPPAPRTYTVVSGDTLWAISERFYGDGSKYQVIADASGVSNPDLIHPGQVLTIP